MTLILRAFEGKIAFNVKPTDPNLQLSGCRSGIHSDRLESYLTTRQRFRRYDANRVNKPVAPYSSLMQQRRKNVGHTITRAIA